MNREGKANILMVDDQMGKLLTYEAILAELGENLIKASSGREALEALLKNDVAVVLMDVSMPDVDGFELADMIRQHPRFQRVAIIFISAVHLTDIDRLRGYQRGAVDYISVPVNPELLRAKVSVFAELHRKTQQLESLNNELRRLSSSMIAAQDEERRRIARELHDGLGQDLAAAKMILEGIDQRKPPAAASGLAITDACLIIDHALQQVRSTSHLLHPPLLDEVGLQSAVQWYVEGLAKRSGIAISFEVKPQEFPRYSPEGERAMFRIVQEALTNIFRHASAKQAWVSVRNHDDTVAISIRDDGKGFSERVVQFRPESLGVGIAGMRQRVKELGGLLRLSNTGSGSILEAEIPVAAVALNHEKPSSGFFTRKIAEPAR